MNWWNDVAEYSVIKWAECEQHTIFKARSPKESPEKKKILDTKNSNIIRDHPTNEPQQGTQGDKLEEGQGGLPELSPLRSGGSRDGQAGRLDRREAVAKTDTQIQAKSQRRPSGSSQLRSDGSHDGQAGGLDRREAVAKKDTQI